MFLQGACLALLLWAGTAAANDDTASDLMAKAARSGDLTRLKNLLNSGVSPDLPDEYEHAPIYYAAAFNQTQAVELLLDFHANPNTAVSRHSITPPPPATPLQYAAELGNRRVAILLIAAGARINEKGPTGRTALHYAGDRLDFIQLLLDEGADVNARDDEGSSPLDEAVWYGSLDKAAILLAHGARLNEPEPETGATPINEAAYKGQVRLVRYLLQFRPDLTLADKKGFKPLENALRMGKDDSAALLLEAQPKETFTPAFLASAMETATKKDEPAALEVMLRRGAEADAILPSGSTPLDLAAFLGEGDVVDVLLKHGAKPNMAGRNGNSPLVDASLKGFDQIVELLLDHGALVNEATGEAKSTALYTAASFGKSKTVELLLKRGADSNLCGTNHKTPYQAAVENGYAEIADLLRVHGGAGPCKL